MTPSHLTTFPEDGRPPRHRRRWRADDLDPRLRSGHRAPGLEHPPAVRRLAHPTPGAPGRVAVTRPQELHRRPDPVDELLRPATAPKNQPGTRGLEVTHPRARRSG